MCNLPMINSKEIRLALLETSNAREVARRFGLPVYKIYYYAKTRHIQLRSPGRPKLYNYDKTKLKLKIKKWMGKVGGLKKLSVKLGIPYHVITNLSKEFCR